jgi:hypothetical protein
MTFRNELLLDVPEDTYHADPCDVPALSQSIAHTLISRSPAHAYLEHPRLGGEPRVATASMDRGSLVHALLLGNGAKIHPVHADDWKTKAAREERDAARADGELPALQSEIEQAFAIVDVVRPKLARLGIVLDGHSEVVVLWSVETDCGPIQCRARIDHIAADGTIYDLKTTGKIIPPRKMGRHFCEYGYEIQAAAYTQAIETVDPRRAGRVQFRNVAIEMTKPHCVTVAAPDGRMRELGERRWSRACERWAECLHSGEWPEYSGEVVYVSPPPWEVTDEEEEGSMVG